MIISPGVSSVPAKREPTITESAPAAKAFAMSPENLIPPSAITGTLLPLMDSATSFTADNWGMPTPAIILVVQILPGPTPTLIASAPEETKSFAASPVAIFPTITSISKFDFIVLSKSITDFE